MKPASPSPLDQLAALRASLSHFESTADIGDSASVAAIRNHLELRIRHAESALRFPPRAMLSPRLEAK
ncbi:hypothetical protein [Occallatibacter savannae]|uniref:hypothetical protein n=1 Tax=Occallatibacter savannae TaxID=1002691 RepID=UPI0013A5546A|nr:hypothetical protein [Occallatibacter savannae]